MILNSANGRGTGVIQDNVYAHMCLNIAGLNDNEDARENREIVAREMSASPLEEAQRPAREYVKKEYKGC